jgi:hypothetical protein
VSKIEEKRTMGAKSKVSGQEAAPRTNVKVLVKITWTSVLQTTHHPDDSHPPYITPTPHSRDSIKNTLTNNHVTILLPRGDLHTPLLMRRISPLGRTTVVRLA